MEEFLDEQALISEQKLPEKKLEYHYEDHSLEQGQELQQTLLDINSLLEKVLEPDSCKKEDILQLHTLVGNQKVQQLLDVESIMPFISEIAPTKVGNYYNSYEREADKIADHITQPSSQFDKTAEGKATPVIQASRKKLSSIIPSSGMSGYLSQTKNQGQSLPEKTRSEMETKLGSDLQKVRIHNDRSSYQANRELGSKAFTYGSHIYFAAHQYNTSSQQGQKLLAHELVHTIQQQKQPSIQAKLDFSKLFRLRKKRADKHYLLLQRQAKSMRKEIRAHVRENQTQHEIVKKEEKKKEREETDEARRLEQEQREKKKQETVERQEERDQQRQDERDLTAQKQEEKKEEQEANREQTVAKGIERIDAWEKARLEVAEQGDRSEKMTANDVVQFGIHAVPKGRQELLAAERDFQVHPKKYDRENATKIFFQEDDIARGGNYSAPRVEKSSIYTPGEVRGKAEKIKAKIRFYALRARARIRKEKIPSRALKAFREAMGYRKKLANVEKKLKAKKKELVGKAKNKLKEKGNQLRGKLNQSKQGRMAVKAFDGVRGYRKNLNKASKKVSAKKKELKGKAKEKIQAKGNQLRDKLNQGKKGRMAVKAFDGARNYRKNLNKAGKKIGEKKNELKDKAKAKIHAKGNQLRDRLNQGKKGRMAVKAFDGVRNYRKNLNKASRKIGEKKKELKDKAKAKIHAKGNQLRDRLNQGKKGRMAVKAFDSARNYRKNLNKASRKIGEKKKELKDKAKAKIHAKGNQLRGRLNQSERGRKALVAFDFARNYRKNLNKGEKKLRGKYREKKQQMIDKIMGREPKKQTKEKKPPRVDKYKQFLEEQAKKKMEKLKEEEKLSQALRLKAESGDLKDDDIREASKQFDLYPTKFYDIFSKRPDLVTTFIAFCEKEKNEKLFHFYSDYNLYRKKPDLGVALKIYKAYSKEGAKEKIDLDDRGQKEAERILSAQVETDEFKEVKRTLFLGMSRGALKELDKIFEKYKTDFETMKTLVLRDMPTRLKDRNTGFQLVRNYFADAILKEDDSSKKAPEKKDENNPPENNENPPQSVETD